MFRFHSSTKRKTSIFFAALASLALILGVSNSASATPVEITTITAGSSPRLVAISPDGTKVFTATSTTKSLMVIDTATNAVINTVALPSTVQTLASMAISPDGNTLYITDQHATGNSVLLVIDVSTSTPTMVSQVSVGQISLGVAISPSGNKVYVANAGSNTISVIDTSTNTVSTTIPAVASSISGQDMDYPHQIAFSPDGTSFFVTYYKDSTGGVAGIVKFDSSNNAVLAKVECGTDTAATGNPLGIDVSSNGQSVYVSSYASSGSNSWIKKYNSGLTSSVDVATSASSNYRTNIIQLSADDTLLYATRVLTGIVNVYNTSTNALTPVQTTGGVVTDMLAPSPNAASHFTYVGTSGSVVVLLGEYLSLQRQTLTGNTGTTLSSAALTASGFPGAVTYSISPGLPGGFTFNTSTGVITGSSSTPFNATTFTITGTSGSVSAVATVTISVTSPGGSGGSGSSGSTGLANTGMNSSLFIATGALGLSLMVLGGVMVYARRIQKN